MKRNILYVLFVSVLLCVTSCSDSGDEMAPDPCVTPPTLDLSADAASDCDQADGAITATASGGDGNFQFSLNGGAFQSSGTFNQLGVGEYTVATKDGNDCTTEETVVVESDISLSGTVSSIIGTNCAISGCHVSGTGLPNFTDAQNIVNNASNIKSQINSGAMPPSNSGVSISATEIDQISCWVDSGAPNN